MAFTSLPSFLYLQAMPPLPQSRPHSQQQPKQTDPKQAVPCWLSSICGLLPSNKMQGALGLPVEAVWGGLPLRCPIFQHFLFCFECPASILIKHSRDTAQSPGQGLPCWFGHGHISLSRSRVSAPSWGSLGHHALGHAGR